MNYFSIHNVFKLFLSLLQKIPIVMITAILLSFVVISQVRAESVYIRNDSEATQQALRKLTGKVTDASGEGIIGASVSMKGTGFGTVTDTDGNFSLNIPEEGCTLLISFVGYTSQDIKITNQPAINITLAEDQKILDEVVVIGYGTRAKKDLTGAISQISSEEITRQVAISPEFAMQGKMAGVMVSNPGSDPVARPTIRIRGVTTLGFNDPLYVIDGVPLAEGGATEATAGMKDLRGNVNVFTMINPNDIESIEVLKDAAATAIYGNRAAGGVIIITTKSNK